MNDGLGPTRDRILTFAPRTQMHMHTLARTLQALHAHSLSLARPLWTPSNWVWIVFLSWDSTVPWEEQKN